MSRTVERNRQPRQIPCAQRAPVARRRAAGFTLIETALTTVIIGVGVLAIVSAQQALHMKNRWSTHASIAQRLGNEIREMTLVLPRHDPVTGQATWGPELLTEPSFEFYDDVDDFDGPAGTGLLFSADDGTGPINARREVIANMDGWSQAVFVENVNPFDITEVVADNSTDMLRVTVVVSYQGPMDDEAREMTTVSWIAPN